ncbi:hypothetical protein EVAR_55049_1 [Eumeta japonica]|uniref:Uncharacterized protein n=1 Tax=Eumeta variegata TaxID=151549 RepID=A0A4C1ZUL0_EUMVA|nr:hypothetical protein EVAR_55049_1 [Eumeta japonica]
MTSENCTALRRLSAAEAVFFVGINFDGRQTDPCRSSLRRKWASKRPELKPDWGRRRRQRPSARVGQRGLKIRVLNSEIRTYRHDYKVDTVPRFGSNLVLCDCLKRDVISKTSETQRHVKHESVNDPRLLAHRKYFRKPIDEEARTTRRSKAKLYQDTSKQRRCPAFVIR